MMLHLYILCLAPPFPCAVMIKCAATDIPMLLAENGPYNFSVRDSINSVNYACVLTREPLLSWQSSGLLSRTMSKRDPVYVVGLASLMAVSLIPYIYYYRVILSLNPIYSLPPNYLLREFGGPPLVIYSQGMICKPLSAN